MSIPTSRHHKFRPAAPSLLIDGNEGYSQRKRAAFLRAAVVAAFATPLALTAQPDIARAQNVSTSSETTNAVSPAPEATAPVSTPGQNAVTTQTQVSVSQSLATNARAAKTVRTQPSASAPSRPIASNKTARTLPAISRAAAVSKTQQAKAWPNVEKGGKAFAANNAAAALTYYQNALAIDPNNPYAQSGLADALFVLKRYAEAETAYRRILLAQPKDAKALRNLGEIQIIEAGKALGENNPTAALTYYQRVLSYNAKDVRAQKGIADALFSLGRYADAETAYQKVLSAAAKD